ncbi:MAG TPA: nucleotide exchange factor GrpE [Longimicrobiales bacterium]|nr:nucleotide exchange factor GrpE [Longimicrobiales bacterium]
MTDEIERPDDETAMVDNMEERRALQVREDAGEEQGASTAVAELKGELDDLNDRHLRLAAEFDNYRKRNERDRDTLAARLQVDLVRPLLEILDDLERVSESGSADQGGGAESVAEGVRLVERKFRSVLEAAGLEALDVAGQPFDPAVMEALMTVPTDDPERDDHVADVFQKGYRFRNVLIRPARVRVLKFDEAAASE